MVVQGGTCIFAGDEVKLLEQAAEIAEQKLKCTAVFGSVLLFKEGYSRARFSALDATATCAPSLSILFVATNGTCKWARLANKLCILRFGCSIYCFDAVHNCRVSSQILL